MFSPRSKVMIEYTIGESDLNFNLISTAASSIIFFIPSSIFDLISRLKDLTMTQEIFVKSSHKQNFHPLYKKRRQH